MNEAGYMLIAMTVFLLGALLTRSPLARIVLGTLAVISGLFTLSTLVPQQAATPLSDSTVSNRPAPAGQAGKPLGRIRVLVFPEDARVTISGPLGYYQKRVGSNLFGNLPVGTYTVVVSKPGFETITRKVELSIGESVEKAIVIHSLEQVARERREQAARAEREAKCRGVQLIVSWNWTRNDYFAQARGQVTNVSGKPLNSVKAEVSFFTADGTFITSQGSFIRLQPILPGQTSTFTIYETYNPAMRSATLSMQIFLGGSLTIMGVEDWRKNRCDQR